MTKSAMLSMYVLRTLQGDKLAARMWLQLIEDFDKPLPF